MKTLYLLAGLCLSVLTNAQEPQTYVTFQGETLNLYKYEGTKTMILANSNSLNSTAMTKWVNATDGTYNFYYDCTEKNPTCYTNVTCFNGKSTLARVDATCGAGCGYLGWTGIELLNSYFDNTYTRILNDNQYDQAFFYEFGRNFWFYDNQLKYLSNDPVVTGYACFMRFMSMESLGLNGAPFNGTMDLNVVKEQIRNLRVTYMNDTSLNWGNTLGVGQGVPNSGWSGPDLFASFCFYLKENYGGMNWVKNVWKKAGLRPTATSTQDAVDNFIIASSQAANTNLVSLFQYWKWPISQSAIDYINSLNMATSETAKNTVSIYPNPVKDLLNFSEEVSNVRITDVSGKNYVKQISATGKSVNVSKLAKGSYIITATSKSGELINKKFIKE